MSLTSVSVRNQISEVKEMLGLGLREHRHQIIIGGIMLGISIAFTLAFTGNVMDAFAGSRRR